MSRFHQPFHLPLSPEELLKSGGVNQYVVQEVLSIKHLPPQLGAFQAAFRAQGPLAMLEHTDTIYSILHHFRSIDPGLKEDTLEFLIKVVSRHSQELPAILDDTTLSVSDRNAHLIALKMNCYAMTSRTNLMDLDLGGRGKKARTKAAHGFDWEEERQPILQLLTQLLQLDIQFVSLVTGCCYHLLENPTISHQKNHPTREAITHLLGVAVTRYNHMLSATVKIIQMPLWATDYGMKSTVGEIVREIGQKCPQELSRDPSVTKGFAAFLTELAERVPAILMSSMCILLDHLDGENYMMHNAVLAAMAEMVLQVLNGDQLEEAFLDTLQARGQDVNSFVWSRVLQLFTRIVQQKALPLTRFQAVVALAVGHLADKSVLVCKNAIQLLASFLANNPFSCKLSDTDIAGPLQRETQKLQEMRAQRRTAAASPVLDPEEWEARLPELKSTLQQLLQLPQGEEEIPEQIANTETTEEVKGCIYQLLAKASYKQAIILTQEATGHFQESEPFSHIDSEETRLLSILETIFKGPANPWESTGNMVTGQTVCKNKPSVSEPEESRRNDELVKQEMLVQSLQDAYSFFQKIMEAIGISSKMMYENTTTVVQEAIEFFVMVFQFGVPQALFGVCRMLPLIWSKEPGVQEAVLNAYRQRYLNPKGDSARAKAQALIQNLSLLLVDASVGTIQCLEEIFSEFVQKDEVKPAVTQLLWEQATKVTCSPLERCSSVIKEPVRRTRRSPRNAAHFHVDEPVVPGWGCALQQLVHLEQAVSGELCRRQVLWEEQEHKTKDPKEKNTNPETTMEEELGLVWATADDTEAELIRSICEMELLDGKQTLAAFVPLLLKVCNNPGLYSNPDLSAAALLALGKFCMISAIFCESQLRLLFTMLEKSPLCIVRSNLMLATGDLAIRFPNLVDPWTPHLYVRLRDPAQQVRKTVGLVMTHLILKDMVKVKGQVSEMAVLLIDPGPQIAALAKNFFNELSHKGNTIYNLLPDIISHLSDPELGVEEEPFHTIMKQLLSYINKDKQTGSLVEKLCLCKMLDNFDCFGDKLSVESIFSAFLSVVGKLRWWAEASGLSHQRNHPVSRHQPLPSAASDGDFVTPKPCCTTRRHPNTQQRAPKKKPKIVFSSDESSEEDLSAKMTEAETPKKTNPIKRKSAGRGGSSL
uniref:Condensin complex subunit 1 n=1 Tax=Saimiri boliviensis boliviensis TaxID=39432 RepID=A0A2K6V8B9_SAIBB